MSTTLRPLARSIGAIAWDWSHSFVSCRHLLAAEAVILPTAAARRTLPAVAAVALPATPVSFFSTAISHHRQHTPTPTPAAGPLVSTRPEAFASLLPDATAAHVTAIEVAARHGVSGASGPAHLRRQARLFSTLAAKLTSHERWRPDHLPSVRQALAVFHGPMTASQQLTKPRARAAVANACRSRLFWSTPAVEGMFGGSSGGGGGGAGAEPKRGLKELFREYGPIAVMVYFALSSTVFLICFSSISFLGVNEQTVMSIFSRLKSLVGLGSNQKTAADGSQVEMTDADFAAEAEKDRKADEKSILRFLPAFMQSPWIITVGTNVLLAMAMTKLFLPLKVGVVVAVTPTVAKRLRAMGFDFGRMKYKDLAQDAKSRIKERAAAAKRPGSAAGTGESV
ncbi:hypothetical protein HDU96_006681 [Phlyctochytrium bullatum]|nr:hypothetical protein HDU96_006681 [Phlyctochytrium bullatum]